MLVRRLAIISLLTGSVMVAAACGDTVTNVEPTAETIGVGELPGGVTDTGRPDEHGSTRTTVPSTRCARIVQPL